jgi:hypothetical protein
MKALDPTRSLGYNVTVSELPPLTAELRNHPDQTAASKLYTALAVPATPPTLTADTPYTVLA